MAAESWRNFCWLSKTFSGNFLRAVYPSRVEVKFKGKQKTVFIVFLDLKDFGGFKGRREMSRFQQKWRVFGWFLARKTK